MIVTCEKCDTQYNVDENKIKGTEARARCVKCDHRFVIKKPQSVKQSAEPEEAVRPVRFNAEARQNDYGAGSDCKVISICNQKGGVAKTTTCLNLGASLMMMGKRVLLIDFDIQANLSLLMGYKDAKSFFDVIHSDGGDLNQYLKQTKHGLWLLPSNSKMALLSKKYLPDENFEYMLRDKLQSIKHQFDYILIDTPPSGDFYTLNALLASNTAVIPSQSEYLSMNGANHIESMINVIREKAGHDIDYYVLLTMYDQTNTACQVILKKLNEQMNGRIFETVIDRDNKIQESHIVNEPVLFYDQDSRAGQQYQHLAEEIITMQQTVEQAKSA